MGSKYVHGLNPFRDFLVESLKYEYNIAGKSEKREIDNSFKYILENVLNNGKEAVHLDFEIINKDDWYRVVGKNPPSALWLSGILVENIENMLDAKSFEIGDRKYKYNQKTGELTFKLKK
jgi:hypothetical protein